MPLFLVDIHSEFNKLAGQVVKHMDKAVRDYLRRIAKKGGAARAKKYDAATLSEWARKGGRPKNKDKAK
jgi:general stress protein YciG